jgi:hypothetical protein
LCDGLQIEIRFGNLRFGLIATSLPSKLRASSATAPTTDTCPSRRPFTATAAI